MLDVHRAAPPRTPRTDQASTCDRADRWSTGSPSHGRRDRRDSRTRGWMSANGRSRSRQVRSRSYSVRTGGHRVGAVSSGRPEVRASSRSTAEGSTRPLGCRCADRGDVCEVRRTRAVERPIEPRTRLPGDAGFRHAETRGRSDCVTSRPDDAPPTDLHVRTSVSVACRAPIERRRGPGSGWPRIRDLNRVAPAV